MKLAYRIVTPILAVGAVVMGLFLKLFTFVVGSTDESINKLIGAVTQLVNSLDTKFEFSAFELIKMLFSGPANPDADTTFQEAAGAIIPDLIAFSVVFVLILLVMLAVGVFGALANSKKRRNLVIPICAGGLVLCFVAIIISNHAFEKIINGDVSLSRLVSLMSENVLATLATAIITVTSATLSAGFYALFGMFLIIIIWTIFANFLIKNPIRVSKTYHRKNPKRTVIKAPKKKAEAADAPAPDAPTPAEGTAEA